MKIYKNLVASFIDTMICNHYVTCTTNISLFSTLSSAYIMCYIYFREPIPVDQKPLPKEPESEEKKTKKQKQVKCKYFISSVYLLT